jgi:alkanesulfonate monooxygenase SsuD/methylene tetrahydromethanopterin reductase-like flavin-dependent oxidoreductase (luciferase family)
MHVIPAQRQPRRNMRDGALLIGSADEVVDKIFRHAEALGRPFPNLFPDERRFAVAGEDDARD